MPYRTPPKQPSIESLGTRAWLERRNFSHDKFVHLVGINPDEPLISKRKLGREIGTKSMDTVDRLLEQYKRELTIEISKH